MRLLRFCLYLLIGIIIYLIPLSFIEPRSFCIWYHLFQVKCFGCGLTHAFFYFIHGRILEAIAYNPMILFLVIIIIILLEDISHMITASTKKSWIEMLYSKLKHCLSA